MKQLKTCLICKKPVAKGLTYQAALETISVNPLTGEMKLVNIKGYVCPKCNQLSGYRTSKGKLKKFNAKTREKNKSVVESQEKT